MNATIACRQFSIDRRNKFKSFGYNSWVLTVSASKNGYSVGGFTPRGDQAPPKFDGTIGPLCSVRTSFRLFKKYKNTSSINYIIELQLFDFSLEVRVCAIDFNGVRFAF